VRRALAQNRPEGLCELKDGLRHHASRVTGECRS
jgi:hypothetical protein